VVDLPGTTSVPMKNQPPEIVRDLEEMALNFIRDPNCIILAVTPANADVATSQALQLAQRVDPTHARTVGVLTKIDLMDKGTNARDVLENRKYPLQMGWVGVVNRSQQDIEGGKSQAAAKAAEAEYFKTAESPYRTLKNTSTQVRAWTGRWRLLEPSGAGLVCTCYVLDPAASRAGSQRHAVREPDTHHPPEAAHAAEQRAGAGRVWLESPGAVASAWLPPDARSLLTATARRTTSTPCRRRCTTWGRTCRTAAAR